MLETDPSQITGLLQRWQQGEEAVLEELWPMVRLGLSRISRKLLRQFVRGQGKNSTLCTTDLVHQAFPKLTRYATDPERPWESRGEFFALAKKVMLCVLLDYHRYAERHGNRSGEELEPDDALFLPQDTLSIHTLMDLEKNLGLLKDIDSKGFRMIQMRFFEDRTIGEMVEETGWTEYKVYLHLKAALGFLYSKMNA